MSDPTVPDDGERASVADSDGRVELDPERELAFVLKRRRQNR
jgi:hypothetical protein